MWAINNNKYKIIKIYSFIGYDFNRCINWGKYPAGTIPLFYANTPAMCGLLINSGSNVNIQNYLGTPLIHAIKSKNYEILTALLRGGAKTNISNKIDEKTDGIYVASVYMNDPEMLVTLLYYSDTISVEKMVVYLQAINNKDYSSFNYNKKKTEVDNSLINSTMLLSTMMPNDQKELINLMIKNSMISKENANKILSNLLDPVQNNIYVR